MNFNCDEHSLTLSSRLGRSISGARYLCWTRPLCPPPTHTHTHTHTETHTRRVKCVHTHRPPPAFLLCYYAVTDNMFSFLLWSLVESTIECLHLGISSMSSINSSLVCDTINVFFLFFLIKNK